MTSYSPPMTISSDDCGLMSGSIGVEPAPSVAHLRFGSYAVLIPLSRLSDGSTHGSVAPDEPTFGGVPPAEQAMPRFDGWRACVPGSDESERSAMSSGM